MPARSTFCYPDSAAEPTDFGVAAAMPLVALAAADGRDALDDCVEARVRGGVRLDRDVEALVPDACHRGTPVEAMARRLPVPLAWHPGYRPTVTDLRRHADHRGPRYADLGARIARQGVITPRVIGDAARGGRHDLQDLKKVWHTLARFGAPEGAGTARSGPARGGGAGGAAPHGGRRFGAEVRTSGGSGVRHPGVRGVSYPEPGTRPDFDGTVARWWRVARRVLGRLAAVAGGGCGWALVGGAGGLAGPVLVRRGTSGEPVLAHSVN